MTPIKTALALFAALSLNGSVALAMAPAACGGEAVQVCTLPLAQVAPPARPAHLVAGALDAAQVAPPRRPADLIARNAAAAARPVAVTAEISAAEIAPPARPDWLGDTAALRR